MDLYAFLLFTSVTVYEWYRHFSCGHLVYRYWFVYQLPLVCVFIFTVYLYLLLSVYDFCILISRGTQHYMLSFHYFIYIFFGTWQHSTITILDITKIWFICLMINGLIQQKMGWSTSQYTVNFTSWSYSSKCMLLHFSFTITIVIYV